MCTNNRQNVISIQRNNNYDTNPFTVNVEMKGCVFSFVVSEEYVYNF